MTAETLLNELHKVRKTGVSKWMACCPAHDDKSPSLSISEGSDGHILIHCFAGCETSEILNSVGLSMTDLFPDRDQHSFDDQPKPKWVDKKGLELEKAKLEFRQMFYKRAIKNGVKFSAQDNKRNMDDYLKLRSING